MVRLSESLDWDYIIRGGDVPRSMQNWNGGNYLPFSGFELQYFVDKKNLRFEDGKIILKNKDYGFYRTEKRDIKFKPYFLEEDLDKKLYCYTADKINKTSAHRIYYISDKRVIFDDDIIRNLKKFRNRFSDRLDIVKINRSNFADHIEDVKSILHDWKEKRLEEKKLFNARTAVYAYAYKRGYEYYDDFDYNLIKIDDKPVAYFINVPDTDEITYYFIGMALNNLGEEKLVGLSAFVYAYGTRYNRTQYRNMGYATGREGLKNFKIKFTTHISSLYFTDLLKEDGGKVETLGGWFE